MKLRDKYGWPVETFKDRPVTNFFSYLFVTSIWQTFRRRKEEGNG